MSLQIDPASVHLGKTAGGSVDNLYVANYVATNPATLPVSCTLPPEIPYTPGNPALLPLLPSCTFNFIDVPLFPPLPTPPSPVTFRGCETLTASVNIITTEATRNTSLSLIAGGPYPGETGTEDCTLKLVGIVDVDVGCANFTATSSITYSGAAAGSTLAVVPIGAPDCGFDLRGRIDIAACETFTTTSNITFGSALKGSYLTFTASDLPNCGLDIYGNVNLNACESFNATSNVSFTGNAVKKSLFSISPTSTPNCGFTLTGDVLIEACTDFTASGGITFSGAAVKSQSVKVTAAQQPNCGLVLSGNVEIDACATFTATNNLRIYGDSVSIISPLSIVSIGTPDCGFALNGELRIDACSSTSVSIVPDKANPSYITLYSNVREGDPANTGDVFSYAQIVLRSAPVLQDGCSSVISLSMDSIDLALPGGCCPEVMPYTPNTITGCCWDEEDGPRLYKDEHKNELYIIGALPEPCFVCDAAGFKASGGQNIPFVYDKITLTSLEVDNLSGSVCCPSRTHNQINLCTGSLSFSDPAGTVTQLYALSSGITLTSGDGVASNIRAGAMLLSDAGRYAELDTASLTIDASGGYYLYASAHSLMYDSPVGKLQIDAGNVVLRALDTSTVAVNPYSVTVTAPAGAYTSLIGGKVTSKQGAATNTADPYTLTIDGGSGVYSRLSQSELNLITAGSSSYLTYDQLRVVGNGAELIATSDALSTTNATHTAYISPSEIGVKDFDISTTSISPAAISLSSVNTNAVDSNGMAVTSTTYTAHITPSEVKVNDFVGNASSMGGNYVEVSSGNGWTYTQLFSTSLKITSGGSVGTLDLWNLLGKTVSFQPLTVCTDAVTGTTKTIYVLMTT